MTTFLGVLTRDNKVIDVDRALDAEALVRAIEGQVRSDGFLYGRLEDGDVFTIINADRIFAERIEFTVHRNSLSLVCT